MTEREKIIETMRASGYGFFITHEITNADEALADTADALIADGIGDVAEWKHRAEVAEKKLLELAMFCTKGNPYLSKEHSQEKEAYKLFNDWLQQAAREIEEERK